MPIARNGLGVWVAAVVALALASPVSAQTGGDTGVSPPAARRYANQIPEKFKPEGSGSSTEPLSKRLDRSGGIVRPPGDVDPGMAQKPPSLGPRSTPVIPPPGTSGDSPVKPK